MTFFDNKRQLLMTISTIAMSAALLSVFASPQMTSAAADGDDGDVSTSAISSHRIFMSAVEMSDGLFAYKMDQHLIDGSDVTQTRYGDDPKPSIPGPTIVIDVGDEVELTLTNQISCEIFPDIVNGAKESPSISHVGIHVHGVHYDALSDATPMLINRIANEGASCGGGTYTYEWIAAEGTHGTWPYHDHTLLRGQGAEDAGLFGTVIVNDNRFPALIDGEIQNIRTDSIDKEYVLWMVSTETAGRNVFYGMEIDNNNGGKQTPLWVNPVLIAEEGDITRWHILGMGDEPHAFHLHAHRWIEPHTEHIIDTEEILPLDRHVFVVKAGEGVGPGDWMYHCHFFNHMEQGMSSTFRVLPSGTDATLPEIGAVFAMSDEPGLWFKTLDAGVIDTLDPRAGTGFPLDFLGGAMADSEGRSLAIIEPGESVLWTMKDSETKHTITSLIWPDGADLQNAPFQFDVSLPVRGSTMLEDSDGKPQTLDTPGLYVYTCKIHPYMFAGIIVDDPSTAEFDLGANVAIAARTNTFPTVVSSLDPLATSLVTTFYVATDPSNWKDYTTGSWEVNHPPVPVTDGTTVVNLSALDVGPVPITAEPPDRFNTGIGEVWINTQFERTINKNDLGTENDKPGTITVVNTEDWTVEQKIALPEIHMNNPHNMWADNKLSEIYQTQWFDKRMVSIDLETGEIIKDVVVGESPSHIVTAPDTGKIYIAMNGEEQITELDPLTLEITRQISTGTNSHPHGHWISGDGRYIVTPNFFTHDSAIIDLSTNPPTTSKVPVGLAPIATGMMPDGSKYYTADFLGNSLTKVDTASATVETTIDLVPHGTGIPVQTPVSPDGKWVVTANVLGSKITVVDTSTDTVVAVLDCDPGCHGVNWGAQDSNDGDVGQYFAYVSSKFSNAMLIVDPDPNEDNDGSDAAVIGKVVLAKQFHTETDDKIIDYPGMGGQGVLPIPNVYNGWIQETVDACDFDENKCSEDVVDYLFDLTGEQLDP